MAARAVILAGTLLATLVGAQPAMAQFGLFRFAISARNQDGTPDTQAGSHPYNLTSAFVADSAEKTNCAT